jgi:calcium and integrin-binding protein 1
MGNAAHSKLPVAVLDELERASFLTRGEIEDLFVRFEAMGGSLDAGVAEAEVWKLPELAHNPFQRRITDVFGVLRDGGVVMEFSGFVEMMSAFSPRASADVKAYWAFKLYDFNGDGFLDREDIYKVVTTMAGETLSEEQLALIARRVLDEADLDGNNKLSRTEFMRAMDRVPDFASYVRARSIV